MENLVIVNSAEFWSQYKELTRQIIREEIQTLPNINHEEILIIEDVCKIVKKKDKTIYNWMKANLIKHHYLGGSLFFLRSEIVDLIKEG